MLKSFFSEVSHPNKSCTRLDFPESPAEADMVRKNTLWVTISGKKGEAKVESELYCWLDVHGSCV